MKLTINNGNSNNLTLQRNMADKTRSLKNKNYDSLSFRGSVEKVISADNAGKVIKAINDTIGSEYFSKVIGKSGLCTNGKITIPEQKFLPEFGRSIVVTLKRVLGAPLNIYHNIANKFSKNPKPIEMCHDDAREAAIQILNKFLGDTKIDELNEDVISRLQNDFLNKTALNITELNPKYHTADERALNRIATSLVSAIFSGWDFFNITMLQKNNKKEAEKAKSERFHLEFGRCFMSASITFAAMSLFEKYMNKSVVLNALTVVGASLVSKIITRKNKGVPLKKLSPKEAKEFVQKQKALKQAQKQDGYSTIKIPFRGKEEEQQIFKLFIGPKQKIQASLSEEYKPLNEEKINSKPKKKKSLSQILGIGIFLASAAFVIGELLNGNIKAKRLRAEIYKNNKYRLDNLSDEVKKEIQRTFIDNNKKRKDFDKLGNIFDTISTRRDDINLTKLQSQLEEISANIPGGAEKSLLNKYLEIIQNRMNAQSDGLLIKELNEYYLKSRSNIPVLSSVVEGVTKLFKNVYQILSTPGKALCILSDALFFNRSEKALKKFEIKGHPDKQIKTLNAILQNNKNESYDTVVKKIMENVSNFKEKPETGELASLSRTMVTAISSYFMINDYSNKVLIESEGKDVKRAQEEYTDRLMQKLSNFFFNGTLMNLANTLFKVPLNNSLLAATVIPVGTEILNQILVRKSICQPVKKLSSREEIIKYEEQQCKKEGFMGWWSRTYRKLTGKKTLSEKIKQ